MSTFAFSACHKSDNTKPDAYAPRPAGTITFNKDIAPIVFNNCSGCHHSGGSAPFDLLTYDDVKKRAKLIVDVTQRRYMPPWLPDPNVVHLVGERRLTVTQLGLIQQWVDEGTVEGNASDLPLTPKFSEGWQLGEPDLVLKPAVPYLLTAEGRDVYRNVAIPIPVSSRRYVRAIEFRPNTRAVHHAFFKIDRAGQARALDGKDGQPGFGGIHAPRSCESPITFASWQPGKMPHFYAEDLTWPVDTNTDLVVQMHLQPIGKVEPIAPEVGLYFADKPGAAIAFKLPLNSYTIDIPAGATNYLATDSFVLPIDVEVRGVLPHAHYLCRRMRGWAELPDGSRTWLMAINEWDFNWQGDYQYSAPIQLPKGTKLMMEYSYDNSTNNARNPNQPPQSVVYGMNSTDEMGELWLQVVMKTREDFTTLNRALQPRFLNDQIIANEALIRRNPNDSRAWAELGTALVLSGKTDDGLERLRQSIQLNPNYDEAHYFVGLALRERKQFEAARKEFETTVHLNPKHARAHGNLGLVLTEQGNLGLAAQEFQIALQLNPQDVIAIEMLKQIDDVMKKQPFP